MANPSKIWRHILELPPIDWALLAHERKSPKRHTPANIAKMKAAWAARKREKRKAAGKAIDAMRRPAPKPVNAAPKILAAMEPGDWYALPDIEAETGLLKKTVCGTVARIEKRGWLERARNPDRKPVNGSWCVPTFLYRLTEEGTRQKAALAFLE